MEKQNKGYYTISELVSGLRKHYLKNQELLDRMNQMLEVSSNYVTNSSLSLKLKEFNGFDVSDPQVILTILKDKPSSIDEICKKLFHDSRFEKDSMNYRLMEKDNHYYFRQNLTDENANNPLVVIPTYCQEDFGSTYQELKNTKFYQLPSLFIRLNPYQELFIWGDGLHLSNHDGVGRGVDINYDPVEDNISIDSNVVYSTSFVNNLLDTKIPKYEFPEEYVQLLDGEKKTNRSIISDTIGRKKEIFDLDEKEKIMLLKRR